MMQMQQQLDADLDRISSEDLHGARLDVSVRARRTVQEIAEATAALNDGVTAARLMVTAAYPENIKVKVDPENVSRVLGSLDWSNKGLVALPECIGDLIVEGDFNLSRNQFSSLPEGIAGITVGGELDLSYNQLSSLPEGIAGITVDGPLRLNNNQLSSLPEGISGLTVGGHLYLDHNQLSSLPEGIAGITVGGNLDISYNQLPRSLSEKDIGGHIKGYVKNANYPLHLVQGFGTGRSR